MVNAKKILLKNFLKIAHVYNSDNRVNYMFSEFLGLLTKWLLFIEKVNAVSFFHIQNAAVTFFSRELYSTF